MFALPVYRFRLVACILLCVVAMHVFAQETDFRADAIPQSLQPYANAVVRFSETVHTITSPSMVETTRRHAVTVMNAQGADEGVIVIHYNKLTQVKSLLATIYDADGRVLKKLKMSDFDNLSMISYFSLYEDDRMLKYVPQVNRVPYTVEYECQLRTKTTFFLPSWRPQNRSGLAIEQSSCRFVTPVNYLLRYNTHGLMPAAEEILPSGKQKQMVWSLKNTPAWRNEPFLPPIDSITPWVMAAPVNFEIDGMKGSFTNWEEFGVWCYNNLLKNRTKLPETTIARVRKMTEGISDPREKARKIYEYCQQKNRYVSIQKGKTGGISPQSAAEVDLLSYGDCKALCNYTRALLEAVGIRAFYAVVQAGERPVNPPETFANANFGNHIILCLPLAGDTVWLECTNNKAPFGYIGSFTGNRKAVLFRPEGNCLARTTVYEPGDNRQESAAEFTLNAEGALTGHIVKQFTGMQYDNRDEALAVLNAERTNELKKIYNRFPDMEILNYSLTFDKNQTVASERLQLESGRFASISGNRMYVPVNPVTVFESLPRDLRTRTHNVYMANGYRDSDSIRISLPAGYQVENIPLSVHLDDDFGTCHFEATVKDHTLHVYRNLQLNSILLPPERYNDVVGFLKKIYDSDHSKLVLVKE